ncbi:MAG: flagellar filament capping protein FliD, partial [Pseudomonadota bacterium]|nr:flagellar filament capping protein FliD [Pseudomonadota bacterium]
GSIDARTSGIETSLGRIEDRRDALDRRLTSLENRLRAQFSAMDALVAQLTATSDFLADQLANLPGSRFLNDN